MKSFVAFFALVAVAIADVSHIVPRGSEADAQISSQNSDVGPEGFAYGFDTSNGISAKVDGQLQRIGEDEAVIQQGSLSYTAPGGERIVLDFTADQNGYHPVGAHLPTPPPTEAYPDHVIRALAYIAAHPPQPEPIRRV